MNKKRDDRSITHNMSEINKEKWMNKQCTMIKDSFANQLIRAIEIKYENLTINIERCLPKNNTVYAGISGFSLLELRLNSLFDTCGSNTHIGTARKQLYIPLHTLNRGRCSFLNGDCGPLAIGAIIMARLGMPQQSDEFIDRILSRQPAVYDIPDILEEKVIPKLDRKPTEVLKSSSNLTINSDICNSSMISIQSLALDTPFAINVQPSSVSRRNTQLPAPFTSYKLPVSSNKNDHKDPKSILTNQKTLSTKSTLKNIDTSTATATTTTTTPTTLDSKSNSQNEPNANQITNVPTFGFKSALNTIDKQNLQNNSDKTVKINSPVKIPLALSLISKPPKTYNNPKLNETSNVDKISPNILSTKNNELEATHSTPINKSILKNNPTTTISTEVTNSSNHVTSNTVNTSNTNSSIIITNVNNTSIEPASIPSVNSAVTPALSSVSSDVVGSTQSTLPKSDDKQTQKIDNINPQDTVNKMNKITPTIRIDPPIDTHQSMMPISTIDDKETISQVIPYISNNENIINNQDVSEKQSDILIPSVDQNKISLDIPEIHKNTPSNSVVDALTTPNQFPSVSTCRTLSNDSMLLENVITSPPNTNDPISDNQQLSDISISSDSIVDENFQNPNEFSTNRVKSPLEKPILIISNATNNESKHNVITNVESPPDNATSPVFQFKPNSKEVLLKANPITVLPTEKRQARNRGTNRNPKNAKSSKSPDTSKKSTNVPSEEVKTSPIVEEKISSKDIGYPIDRFLHTNMQSPAVDGKSRKKSNRKQKKVENKTKLTKKPLRTQNGSANSRRTKRPVVKYFIRKSQKKHTRSLESKRKSRDNYIVSNNNDLPGGRRKSKKASSGKYARKSMQSTTVKSILESNYKFKSKHETSMPIEYAESLISETSILSALSSTMSMSSSYSFSSSNSSIENLALDKVNENKKSISHRSHHHHRKHRSYSNNENMDDKLNKICDEVLNGRSGYLYSLLFLQKYLGPTTIPENVVIKIFHTIISSGRKLSLSESHASPLLYKWHDKLYYGAGHGMAGIIYILLKVDIGCLRQIQLDLVIPSAVWIMNQQFKHEPTPIPRAYQTRSKSPYKTESLSGEEIDFKRKRAGNFPSRAGRVDDLLVQWCHGSPGIVYMLIEAHRTSGDDSFMIAARSAIDDVWNNGVLRKGHSLCHGTSGNAYSFLAMYKYTMDAKYLHRAVKFAEFMMNDETIYPKSLRPNSLYEGLAGEIYFLADLLDPLNAAFPGFEL